MFPIVSFSYRASCFEDHFGESLEANIDQQCIKQWVDVSIDFLMFSGGVVKVIVLKGLKYRSKINQSEF